MKMRVILKSGVDFEIEVKSFTSKPDALGTLVSLSWVGASGAPSRLNYIRLDDVAAVLAVDSEAQS